MRFEEYYEQSQTHASFASRFGEGGLVAFHGTPDGYDKWLDQTYPKGRAHELSNEECEALVMDSLIGRLASYQSSIRRVDSEECVGTARDWFVSKAAPYVLGVLRAGTEEQRFVLPQIEGVLSEAYWTSYLLGLIGRSV